MSVSQQKDIEKEIREVIEAFVRPALQQDGGDIEFCSFENGTAYVKLLGACSGCPMAQQTLQLRVEHTLRCYVPEVVEVSSVL